MPVVRAVVTDRRTAHPDATLECDLTAPDGTAGPVAVPVVEHLRLVLDELLENAVEHGDAEPWVRVSLAADGASVGDGVELVVEDDGPGIPEDERAVVAGETAITRATPPGSVWTVRMVTESMGGDVRFESTGTGSRVVLFLPAHTSGQA